MKTNSLLLLIVLSFFCLNLKAQNRWIEDSQMKFKISVPNNYQTNEFWDGPDKIHAFVSPDQNVAVRVRSIAVPANTGSELIMQAFSQNVIKGAQQMVNQAFTLNGMNGQMAAYKWKYNKINVVIGAFYTVQNSIAYVVWTMIPENLFAKRNAESDAITNSFTVLADATPTATTSQSGGLGGLGGISNSQPQVAQELVIFISEMKIGSEATADAQILQEQTIIDPSSEKIYFVFAYNGNAIGKTFVTKWYNESSNVHLGDSPFFPSDAPSGRGMTSIDNHSGNWSKGNYRVEIWLNDRKLDEKRFEVREDAMIAQNTSVSAVSVVPAGFLELVSDDACVEHFIPRGYQISSSELGQSIWGDGSGLNMVQQVVIKQTDFDTFMDELLSDFKSKGAEVVGSSYLDVNGLRVCQYIYTYGDSVFSYLSTENNNVFYLLGFVGNVSGEDRAVGYSNTIINSFKKADCSY